MFRSKFLLLVLGLLLVAVSSVTKVQAQAVYGSVSGVVADSTGAVVPGATVTIRSIERNTTDVIESNESGIYVKERLLPGSYEVKVEKAGFKQSVVSPVRVNVDTSTNTDVALETGQVTETVTVSGSEGELLKTDRADVATTFESRQLTELPILSRNFTRFVLLTPGTQPLGWQHAASENPQGSTQTIVNGQSFSGTGYQLDGTDNRDPILGIIVVNPTLESIGETKVTSQNYDAEFGQAIAGVVSVQTKSGANDFFGSAFAFRQNDVLQARNPFSQATTDPVSGKLVPDSLRNQFGGSVGGRIIRDKLFFFNDYQGTRSKLGGSRRLTVPTVLARTGNLSQYVDGSGRPIQIFDPATRQQFASNIIPTGRLSPQAQRLLQLIPLPNAPGVDGGTRDNFVVGGTEIFDANAYNVRIDGRLTEKMNIFGRYSYLGSLRDGETAFGQGGGSELVTLGGVSKGRNQSLAIGMDYTLSPTAIVDVRFGFFRYKVNVLPFDFGTTPAADAGIPGLNLADIPETNYLPAGFVRGQGEFNFGSGLGVNRVNAPLTQIEDQYQVVSNLTKTVGNHTLKFGVDVRRAFNLRVPSDNSRAGELYFENATTASATGAGGLGLATFLLGEVTDFRRYYSQQTDAAERQWRHFYYGQDTWRTTPKLTLAYGLRLDVINPQEINAPGNAGFLDLDTGEIRVVGVGDTNLKGNVENSLNFAPRLGAAYQPTEKLVLRLGYGRSYDIGVFGSMFGHSVTQNLPVLAVQNLNASRVSGAAGSVFNLATGPQLPNLFGLNAPPNRGGVPNTSLPANGRIFLPNGVFARALPEKQRLPTVDAYNVTLQYQLSNTTSVEAAYVGNKGSHTFAGDGPGVNINQPAPVNFGTDQNARRPYFQRFGWTQDVDFFCNCADNRYDSLQTKFTRRFNNSFSINANYTLARSLQNDGNQFFYNRELTRGAAGWDRKHTFIFTNVADIPVGRGRRFLTDAPKAVDYIIGGFQFNSATRIASGRPFDIGFNRGDTYSGQSGAVDVGPDFPNLVSTPELGVFRRNGEIFFINDPGIGGSGSAFGVPTLGQYGDLGRNVLRGPWYWNTDASLFKKFFFNEKTNLEFRVEVQNLFNHVNLSTPDGGLGSPGSRNQNFGRINGVEGEQLERNPQRNFQFALRLQF
ncbi:MAG: TonB-dependent receptor [Pyrinomonadaceae bacterium]|nr:TonB-dependent receptor [Pyrinomonadaceae bacterium]